VHLTKGGDPSGFLSATGRLIQGGKIIRIYSMFTVSIYILFIVQQRNEKKFRHLFFYSTVIFMTRYLNLTMKILKIYLIMLHTPFSLDWLHAWRAVTGPSAQFQLRINLRRFDLPKKPEERKSRMGGGAGPPPPAPPPPAWEARHVHHEGGETRDVGMDESHGWSQRVQ
jgi:hypothetical protein